VPVYDYVLVSEPLSSDQRRAIGWARRQGLSDANNQFHYFRLTGDDRILWGGYDAIHHPGSRVAPELDRRPATFARLEAQFGRAFPQLDGLAFPYRWGGAIDTTSRFTVTFGLTMGGRSRMRSGTGLGVGASRWAGGVMATSLRPARTGSACALSRACGPSARTAAVRGRRASRRELDEADRNEGGDLLQTLDALGIGFDS
jgi:glycine/D-amino acid oxidase-like deaminating enzyme